MKLRFFKATIACVLSVAVFTASAFAFSYVVKKGDTLSTIANRTIAGKIYGKNGGVKKLVALNPQIKNADLIFPGDKINLASEDSVLSESSSPAAETTRAPAQAEIPAPQVVVDEKPAPSTPPAKAPSVDENEGRHGIVEVSTGLSFFKIDATDSTTGGTATILSNANANLDLSWKQVLSATTQTHLDFHYAKLSLSDPTPRTIASGSESVFGFDVGVDHNVNERFKIFSSLGYKQELLLKSLTSSTLTLDRVFVPTLTVGVGYDFFNLKPFKMGAEFSGFYHAPTEGNDLKLKGGAGFMGLLKMQQAVKALRGILEGSVFFKTQNQDTDASKQTRTDTGVTLGVSWSFE